MKILDGALRSGVGTRNGHKLTRHISLVANLTQSGQDASEIQMSSARMPTIGVGHVEVEDPLTAGTNAVLDGGFLDIHVEGIEQQAEILCPYVLDEVQALCHRVN